MTEDEIFDTAQPIIEECFVKLKEAGVSEEKACGQMLMAVTVIIMENWSIAGLKSSFDAMVDIAEKYERGEA